MDLAGDRMEERAGRRAALLKRKVVVIWSMVWKGQLNALIVSLEGAPTERNSGLK